MGKRALKVTKVQTGRPRQWQEDMVARFSKGTFARMDALRRPGEARTEFIREAVDHELQRREEERRWVRPAAV